MLLYGSLVPPGFLALHPSLKLWLLSVICSPCLSLRYVKINMGGGYGGLVKMFYRLISFRIGGSEFTQKIFRAALVA